MTKQGKYNRLAEIIADENDVDVKVARFQGVDKSILVGLDDYERTSLLFVVQNVLGRLDAENITKVTMTGSQRIEKRLLNPKALREAFLNAINHNDWTQTTPPAIYLFSNRIEIISQGGLPEGQTEEDFFLGVSRPRNKELMDIMRHFDFAEATGHGVPDIIKAYGREVFKFSANYINVTLPYDVAVMKTRLARNEGRNEGRNDGRNDGRKLSKFEDLILNEIQKKPKITVTEMIKITNKSRSTIERTVKKLTEYGIIERTGSTKSGQWIIRKNE